MLLLTERLRRGLDHLVQIHKLYAHESDACEFSCLVADLRELLIERGVDAQSLEVVTPPALSPAAPPPRTDDVRVG